MLANFQMIRNMATLARFRSVFDQIRQAAAEQMLSKTLKTKNLPTFRKVHSCGRRLDLLSCGRQHEFLGCGRRHEFQRRSTKQ